MAYPIENCMSERFVAEQVHLYATRLLSQYPALVANEQTTLRQMADSAEQVVLMMRTWMLAGRIPSNEGHETVEWPDGVWQTFKHLHMPLWFKKRWPVRMIKKTFTVVTNNYFVCPHLVTDPQQRHVKFMATGTPLAGMR